MRRARIIAAAALAVLLAAGEGRAVMGEPNAGGAKRTETAVLGGGCFWCLEAVFEELAGVTRVESGYAGGRDDQATYKEVCSGETGHAEVVRVTYDPAVVSYEGILTVFFGIHDPTTLNRQGADVGTQYRSVIFAGSPQQERAARALIRDLEAEQVFPDPIVTRVEPLRAFHRAEDYHQDYYRNNQSQGYCQMVIAPKLAKFREKFAAQLKR